MQYGSAFRGCVRVLSSCLLAAGFVLAAGRDAYAQFMPRPLQEPATGETFHIEGSVGLWTPGADIEAATEGLGIVGTSINFKQDLGLTDQPFPYFQVVVRPARKHKFRFDYTPISYTSSATLQRDVIFDGIRYTLGLPVNSQLSWNVYRVSYEYDFLQTNRLFAGLITEVKITDVQISLNSPVASEYAHARAPIPALGGIVRVYVVPNIAITGEASGITIPSSASSQYNGQYVDFDVYGTLNFTNNLGVQAGYRLLNASYVIKQNTGDLTLQGLFFGAVVRY